MKRIKTELRRHWAFFVVFAFAVPAFFLSTEPWVDPSDRFRIIMAAILLDTVAIVWLLQKNGDLLTELRSRHRAETYVRSLRGVVETLVVSLENGTPLPDQTRQVIYRGMLEQLNLYDAVVADAGLAPSRSDPVVWEAEYSPMKARLGLRRGSRASARS